MNDNEYLRKVLESQTLDPDGKEMNELQEQRDKVEKLLRKDFSESSPTIRYGGSKAKDTMIIEAYDLDVICYFPHDDTAAGETLKDIYENAEKALLFEYLVERKASALRLKDKSESSKGRDLRIDVVPGRYVDDTKTDVFLYRSNGEKERLKTNLDVHIKHVKESGVVDAIRLLKLWRFRNGLSIKHFALELLVVDLLKSHKKKELTDQLTHVWTKFRDEVDDLSIKDPANPTGNDLSELLNSTVRSELESVARRMLKKIADSGWKSVFGEVDEKGEEEKKDALRRAAASVSTPTRPWSKEE